MWSEENRLRYIRQAVAGAFLFCIAISLPLWLPVRAFPFAPLVQHWAVPAIITVLLLVVLIMSLGTIIRYPHKAYPYYLVFCTTISLWTLDLNRLYPSFYEFILLFVLICPRKQIVTSHTHQVLIFFLSAIYVWTGVHKITPTFLPMWHWLTTPLAQVFDGGTLAVIGLIAPIVEFATGILLLTPATRQFGVWLGIIMHVPLLFFIGPLRHWNNAAWAWNVSSLMFLFIIGWKQTMPVRWKSWKSIKPIQWSAMALVWIAPGFGLFGFWDPALSFNVYSGNHTQAYVSVPAETFSHIPPSYKAYFHCTGAHCEAHLFPWAVDVFGGGPQPGIYVLKRSMQSLCQDIPSLTGRIEPQTYWLRFVHEQAFSCGY